MAALVQTIPQQNGTVTLLQTRPSSSTTGQNSIIAASQIMQPHVARGHSMSIGSYNGVNNTTNRNSVAPYAFTSTPGLLASTTAGNVGNNNNSNHSQRNMAWSPQVRPDSLHTSPSPVAQNITPSQSSHHAAGSVSSSGTSSNSSSRVPYISQDDSILASRRRTADVAPRPVSTISLSTSSPSIVSSPSSPSLSSSSKPLPDRYRRVKRTTADDNTNPVQAAVPIPSRSSSYESSATAVILPQPSRPTVVTHTRTPSADDTRVGKQSHPDVAKRYRRRSWANIDAFPQEAPLDSSSLFAPLPELNFTIPPPSRPESTTPETSRPAAKDPSENKVPSPGLDSKYSTNTSHDLSPLSSQVINTPSSTTASTAPPSSVPSTGSSPAAQRLADISRANGKKPGKSRLRRAFSFGSAAELRKVSVQNSIGKRDGEQTAKDGDELDPEQAAIAAQQEANGLGNSIYSHQLGSTDNLSISSTASSASIMLRKMGRGMKRSTRSLVGLFRPRSIINESADAAIVEPTAPQLSVVNIEAERKVVTANADPHEQSGGNTLFPKIQPARERSKAPAPAAAVERTAQDMNHSRKSIAGGDRERAEVLAAVKKGILKRSGSASPVGKPVDLAPPHLQDSPNSSSPSTPEDHSYRVSHRRTDTVKIEGEDYFIAQNKYGADSRSASITPSPVPAKSIVFSPRIQFHETWPSGEYDRRGETATCNKLTPLLAQQIKEELNTFKMEMEVHETSKIYTHFL